MVDRCPRCDTLGLLRIKKIYGYKYFYFRHSGGVKPTWHYLGKEKPRDESSFNPTIVRFKRYQSFLT